MGPNEGGGEFQSVSQDGGWWQERSEPVLGAHPAEAAAGSLVELDLNFGQVPDGVDGEIGALREVVA